MRWRQAYASQLGSNTTLMSARNHFRSREWGHPQACRCCRCLSGTPVQSRTSSTGPSLQWYIEATLKSTAFHLTRTMRSMYEYTRFADSSQQIRLLHLQPSDDEASKLVASIKIYEVPTDGTHLETRFEALSYTWGKASAEKHLYVNDKLLLITDNLETFLRTRR